MKGAFRTLKKHGFCYIYLLPFFSLFALFVIAPVVVAIVLSFTDFNMLQTPDFVWLDNYSVLLSGDNIFIKSVVNTLTMALVVGPVSYIGSLLLACCSMNCHPSCARLWCF